MTAINPELVMRSVDETWDRERWEQLPDDGNRYEVIDGVLYMSEVPSAFHQWVVGQLIRLVALPLESQSIGYPGLGPLGVFMPGCDPVQPDFLFVRAERSSIFRDRYVMGIPHLIVEVLSPSNWAQGMFVKRRAYARAGVPEYWIIRPGLRDVIVCWEPEESLGDFVREMTVGSDDDLSSPTLPVHFKVADLFAGSPDTTL